MSETLRQDWLFFCCHAVVISSGAGCILRSVGAGSDLGGYLLSTNNNGIRVLVWLLTAVFVTLKLTHNIDWSWWWVFAPLWIAAVVRVVTFAVALVVARVIRRRVVRQFREFWDR